MRAKAAEQTTSIEAQLRQAREADLSGAGRGAAPLDQRTSCPIGRSPQSGARADPSSPNSNWMPKRPRRRASWRRPRMRWPIRSRRRCSKGRRLDAPSDACDRLWAWRSPSYALPQEPPATNREAEQGDPWIWWKWANFAILAVGLGYLIAQDTCRRCFASNPTKSRARWPRPPRSSRRPPRTPPAIEARLANLQSEIENLRETAHADMAAESERIRRETEHHLQRIREQSAQEIALMTRSGQGRTAEICRRTGHRSWRSSAFAPA